MDQPTAKKILQELVKREDLNNKVCVDCSNPNPQWASLGFAVFMCLQCAGAHRGYGVHITFVRSISMDTWQEDQIKRMQTGGNSRFMDFMRSYTPQEQGGYSDSASSYDRYHCWAATQYRQKLDAELADKPWSQSAPPASTAAPDRPSSAQGLRKSRASGRAMTGSSLRSDSASPASFNNSPGTGSPIDQKTANESYFATLGGANATRPDNLPPSQGGRYQGFGNSPSPPSSQHPSWGMSSAAAPTFNDLQENPMAALSKGWSLFSSAVAGATKVVNENVIRPGMERVNDPEFQANVQGYLSEAQKRAAQVGTSANTWSKQQFGVDVAENARGAVSWGKDQVGGGPQRSGYGHLAMDPDDQTSALYHDDEDDFFGKYGGNETNNTAASSMTSNTTGTTAAPAKKNSDWDDEWKDF